MNKIEDMVKGIAWVLAMLFYGICLFWFIGCMLYIVWLFGCLVMGKFII